MALHESALEELGLAPLWVRRGMGQASAGQGEAAESAAVSGSAAGAEEGAALHTDAQLQAPAHAPSRLAAQGVAQVPARAGRDDEEPPGITGRASDAPAARRAAPAVQPTPSAASAPPEDDFAWFDASPSHPASQVREVPAEDSGPTIHTLEWDALGERVASCERCRLCEKRTNTVFGVGDRDADWMLIGEAPGENEDRQGEPFVGQAGKLLDNMLRSLTLARDTNVYIANVIKCRPPGNRNPEPDEVARCEPYLQRQVALVKPKLIVALGRFAAQSLLKTDASISSLRGRVHAYEGVPVIVTYHPAYLLRSLPDKAKAWTDLCLARDTWLKSAGTPPD
ncbi:uracil-DNA glycosylase [Paraburkholderia sp.]|jgi:DNA polymerase|uniref:uracil-DNA glycosylase n=1 Tax=Paraburkholderia sp. TaxID=1926495 RepID=UPI002F42A094